MKLICLAHRGEAQAFIKGLKSTGPNFYQGSEYSVLITGEGFFKVLTKLPYIIGKYGVTDIINYGIAGATDKSLKLDEIYPIRTIYAHDSHEPYFHSYTTENESKLDLITTHQRVLSDEFSKDLFNIAPIVDREAWAIGKVASEFKIPFFVFKLISDYAGSTTECFDIKDKALEFSNHLFEHYLSENFPEKIIESDLELPFHVSFTQQKRIESLLLKASQDTDSLISNFEYKNPRTAASEFIDYLEDKVNPINSIVQNKLNLVFKDYKAIGADILFDKKLDLKKYTLKMEINSQANIDKLKNVLKDARFETFEKIINGDFDV